MQRCRHTLILATVALTMFLSGTAQAAVRSNVNPFNIIAKIAIDRTQVDAHHMVGEIAESIKHEFADYDYAGLLPISAVENMEGAEFVDVVHFPPSNVMGQIEYAALVEFWSDKDNYFLQKLSPKYGMNAPWAISVYTISAPTLGMLNAAHGLDISGNEDQLTDYIVVAALNPKAVSKVGYTDLSYFKNMMFNYHCDRVSDNLDAGATNALVETTDLDWDIASDNDCTSFFSWWNPAPSFDVNDLLTGVAITSADVAALPEEVSMPSVTVANADASDVAAALKGYMRATLPMYKPGAPLASFNGLVRQFMAELFAWNGQEAFVASYANPMTADGLPMVDVNFADIDDMKAQLPALLDMFFVPMWTGQNPAGMPLMTQGWKFPRAFALGYNNEVQVVELCTMFYAGMALGTGMHHSPGMPCMAAVYQDGDDAVAQMFTAKATFAAFFKDSVIAMDNMNMDVQTYLFGIFPEVIYNDVAAMYNGAFQMAGIDARFEIRPFSQQ